MNEDVFVSTLTGKELDNYVETIENEVKDNEIILYHQDCCGMCKTVEMMLNRNNIEYKSVKDLEVMKSKGITATPTLEVDGQRFVKKECLDYINSRG